MAKNDKSRASDEELTLETIASRLELLDQRLDNIDSIVTAVVERVMKQPISFNITCPKCGGIVEIAVVGQEKPRR